MPWRVTTWSGVLLIINLGVHLTCGQVYLNEVVATSAERTLQRASGQYPWIGNTTSWPSLAYDDSQWRSGPGPFGFGSFSGVTLGTDVAGMVKQRAASLYLRKSFSVTAAQAASGAALFFTLRYNDGFIAFLNGREIARRNMGNLGMFAFHDQTAFNPRSTTAGAETINIGAANTQLIEGENVLCVQVHNQAVGGSVGDTLLFLADLQLVGGATLVTQGSDWKYFPGLVEPSGGVLDYGLYEQFLQGSTDIIWTTREFDDSSWPLGPGPVGREGGNPPDYALGVNLYSQVYNVTPSIYTRRVFSVAPAEASSSAPLRLTLDYDDAVIVYLNGHEVLRRNIGSPGDRTPYNALAASVHNANGDNGGSVSGQEEVLLIGAAKDWLSAGDNVLAVQLHDVSKTGSDGIARVTLETTEAEGRILVEPTDAVRYFAGSHEPEQEVMRDDLGPLPEPPDAENDWIELYNSGSSVVSLSGWSLTDDAASPRKWMFPSNTVISAGGYLLVLATGNDLTPEQGASYLHANFSLSAQGEYLGLVNADGNVVSELTPGYPPQTPLFSYGRDAEGNWGYFALATPGATNSSPLLTAAPAAPEFSTVGGFHEASFSLTLSTTPSDAEIRYTLDGSEPNPGLLYTGPLSITTDQIVRARAVRSGAAPSRIVTHTYLMQETAAKKSLPALCLGGDPALTYYGPNASGGPALGEGIFAIKGGTYVAGTWTANNDTAAFNFPMLLGRASEKPGTLEFYPLNGEPLRTDLGVRLSGSPYSRPRYTLTDAPSARFTPSFMRKPSFNLYFRSEWGERPQEYPFFADAATTRFKDIRVRAGKNDIQNPFILDEWVRRLFIAMGQQGSLGTFNTLYINGVFKGYYNLCEHLREAFMQEHYQSSEAWDVQQVNDFTSGNATHWKKTLAYVRGANLSDPEAYRQVSDYLEVDNYIDYLILNSFSAMWDWPNNNWVAARERSESGRWRFYVWDAEGSFGQSGRDPDYNSFTSDLIIGNAGTTGDNYIPALYTLLRVSPEFRLRFADRVQKHFFNDGALVRTNIQAIYQTLRAAINPIMLEVQGSAVNDSFYDAWIVNDTRRDIYFTQLSAQNLWPSLIAPSLSHLGGVVASGLALNLSNPNGYGTIYFTTDGTDPRALGGAIAGTAYTNPITIQQTTTVQARVRSESGDWSPVIVASFIVPTSVPVFLPTGSGDWTLDDNWSSAPLPYPNDIGQAVAIPPADADRNVNLRAPVTVGVIQFPQGEATTRNRVRDQGTDNSLTFQQTNGPALIEVGGDDSGYVEFDVGAGVNLQSDLQLTVTNLVGDADYGALRLRNNWSGPGGLIKAGLGIASLTGDAKTYTGSTVIEQGVLQVTGPAAPIASSSVSVQSGGQLRLTSGSAIPANRAFTLLVDRSRWRGPDAERKFPRGKRKADWARCVTIPARATIKPYSPIQLC